MSRNASSPSLSGNRRCQDGLGVSTLEPNCPSVFPLILLLPSRSYFLPEEISLARPFLILVATYFQKHANRKLHYIAHKIGSHITKSPILDWLPLLTKSTIHLKLASETYITCRADQKAMGNRSINGQLNEILHLKGIRWSIEGTRDEYSAPDLHSKHIMSSPFLFAADSLVCPQISSETR